MHRPDGTPVSPDEICTPTVAELEWLRENEHRVVLFGNLQVPTGPVVPDCLRRLFRLDRNDLISLRAPLPPGRF